jgi:hypothetical protein
MVWKPSLLAFTVAMIWGGTTAALDPDDRCESAKLKVAGKYDLCRLKAESKGVRKGEAPDYTRCDAKFSEKWTHAETTAGLGVCPSEGDEAAIQTFISQHVDDLAVAISGGPLPNCPADLADCQTDLGTCNGDLATCDADRATCDVDLAQAQSDLAQCESDLTACEAAGQGQRIQTGQTTCYNIGGIVIPCGGTGQDGELQKGLTPQFVDNGDGTITDARTGLMWEKLSDDGSIHDWDNTYMWPNAFSTKVATLNTSTFAGFGDWRVPNVNELQSIASYGASNPAVNAAFDTACTVGCTELTCSCTQPAIYWSSTTYDLTPTETWLVNFGDGRLGATGKAESLFVRAVRGGV